ncbi:glycosyl hydrolase 115 family protein [Flavobacterium franklandianum]|uniref:Glycosyl hydrolase n=1 Tax=Flavobacterium franklandianum TaxID=2594430 RepID=A0A553CP74_9FLAO|nr:glycosyl hydrolase 115 family protein [Flavobacterium franklandianum]TRX22279.1 glycosyl hydrolase [Flavobacterium franklandianum]
MFFKTINCSFFHPSFRFLVGFLVAIFLPTTASAIGEPSYISTIVGKNFFTLSATGKSSPLFIGTNDYPGVLRALKDLQSDIKKVTNFPPNIVFDKLPNNKQIVIVGTYGKSPIIDKLVKSKKIDIKDIVGKWEAYTIQTVDNPFPGIDKALVIVGNDKRGTIYGIYDLSQQIGVSPWYFWADVSVAHKDALYVKPIKHTQSPSVKYRGIFINDEAPALSNWIKEKYGMVKPSQNPPIGNEVANYGSEFYSKVFELMLRIKANYLWPAMWNNAFNEDDAKNSRLADEYGIVMGTSHQEPMIRAQQEWDRRYFRTLGHWNYKKHTDTLEKFWREGVRRNKNYESIVTLGLRGANDSEMEGDLKSNIAMVEGIVKKQQKIISEEMNSDINQVPQSWCLYKEIMDYYNEGMKVPDNITLLWSDDNWGNLRRLPTPEERLRAGGSGVYYHFDYHGGPRSYEWINTNPISKIWDQMSLAKQYGADRIWIVNVGHFKGYELPMEYFMSLAWDTNKWTNSNINEYTQLWAAREFGDEYANEIADILSKYTKYNGRRKIESLTPQTYSVINYQEAENVVADFNKITAQAEAIYAKLPKEKRDAFYQIVLFPTKASALVNELYYSAARNNLYASQKRVSANVMAAQTRELFKQDKTLMNHYNQIYADGRWNHFMDQTHLGYNNWMPPRENSLRAVPLLDVQPLAKASMGISIAGTEESWPGSSEKAILPDLDIFNNKEQFIEIFNSGKIPFEYTIKTDVPWLTFSESKGKIDQTDKRIWVKLNENLLPKGKTQANITISGAGKEVSLSVQAFNPEDNNIKGFVESGGLIAIEAEHFSKNKEEGDRKWIKIDDYGLTLSGMRATAPANSPAATPKKDAPCLEYPVYLFSKDKLDITLITSPLLNFIPNKDIQFAVSFDDQEPQYVTNVPNDYKINSPEWSKAVVDQARQSKVSINVPQAGYHNLKVWMVDPGVVIEKIIINTGGLRPSYLGPKESYFKK